MRKLFLLIVLVAYSCENKSGKVPITVSELSSEDKLLDGLYVSEYSNSDFKGIRIYSDNTVYNIHQSLGGRYSDSNLNLDYEVPMKFYLENDLMYLFHLDEGFEKKLKNGTLTRDEKPSYRIISVDTFNNGYSVTQEVLIQDYYSEDRKILLVKSINDTIERDIKYHPGEYSFDRLYDLIKEN